jgi:Ca-activated chloride channel family protein
LIALLLALPCTLTGSSTVTLPVKATVVDESQEAATKAPGPAKPADDDKIKLATKLVSLTVTVADPMGRFVTGLKKENFVVHDDDIRQQIAHFSDEDAPVTMGFIYDVSGSMSSLTAQAFHALRRFFDNSHEDDEYFIVSFNSKPQLVQDFTSLPSEITSRVVFIKAGGSTALIDAVYLAVEKAKQGRHKKRALLLISDGLENSSRYSFKELREKLKESDVAVYSIGWKVLAFGGGTLDQISNLSGGRTFEPPDDPQMRDIYARIAVMLRHQYVIGFYPTDAGRRVDWHKVRVSVLAPKGLGRLTLHYKKQYQSFQ